MSEHKGKPLVHTLSCVAFEDSEIVRLDLEHSPENVIRLVTEYLCGQRCDLKSFEDDKPLLKEMIEIAKDKGLTYNQFNELLLLLNQDRIGRGFFDFFFERTPDAGEITLEDLKKGITKSRGFALLCFGNFRFAYKRLIKESREELVKGLLPYSRQSLDIELDYSKRPKKMLGIQEIPREITWFVGELSGQRISKEIKESEGELREIKKRKNNVKLNELTRFRKRLYQMDNRKTKVEKQAFRNADIYLTWDYMDVYVATSMRNSWEYEETFDFTRRVFGDSRLKDMNLRYFDPTQSKCSNPREKGLIEGLMLKQASCTIYLAQESDTMGKDSELAATLAQSKAVIAYIPKHDPKQYSQKIKNHPLSFFKKRLMILDADEVFDEPDCIRKLRKCDRFFGKRIDDFLDKLNDYRSSQHYQLWIEKDEEFKKDCQEFRRLCEILAIAECYYFDKRADTLKERHPLSMQVDLFSGVANGVLVVRTPEECAELLYRILTNRMKFIIKHEKPKHNKTIQVSRQEGYTVLEEEISRSPFRVIVDYERLTNSFWNLWQSQFKYLKRLVNCCEQDDYL